MANFHADTMTSVAVPSVHAGVNAVVSNITLNETASGSVTVQLAVLPGGARLLDCTYLSQTGVAGTGGEAIYISLQGRGVIPTTADAPILRMTADSGAAWATGERLTSDATLTLQLCNAAGTGTASQVIRVVTQYLADNDPD